MHAERSFAVMPNDDRVVGPHEEIKVIMKTSPTHAFNWTMSRDDLLKLNLAIAKHLRYARPQVIEVDPNLCSDT